MGSWFIIETKKHWRVWVKHSSLLWLQNCQICRTLWYRVSMLTACLSHHDLVYRGRNFKPTGARGTVHSHVLSLSLVYDGWEAGGNLFWHISVCVSTHYMQHTLTHNNRFAAVQVVFISTNTTLNWSIWATRWALHTRYSSPGVVLFFPTHLRVHGMRQEGFAQTLVFKNPKGATITLGIVLYIRITARDN